MICSINKSNISLITDFCDKNSVFACEIYSSLKTYGKDCSWVYAGLDENGNRAFCSIKTVMSGYMVYAESLDYNQLTSLAEFFMFMPKKNIISTRTILDKLQCFLGGIIDEKLIMNKAFDSLDNKNMKSLCSTTAIHPKKYVDMFCVLNCVFKNDCPTELMDDWIYTTSLKERKARSKVSTIYQDNECVSCGFLDCVNSYCVTIASLATRQGFEGKGYATTVLSSLLKSEQAKNKGTYVVLLNNNLESFYKKLGFKINDKYCILKY